MKLPVAPTVRWLEVLVLIAPMSLLLGVAAPIVLAESMSEWMHPYGPILVTAVVAAAAAMLALWALAWSSLVACTRFGPRTFRLLIALCAAGSLAALSAFVSNRLPPSPEYSQLWHLRDSLAPFALGLAMLVPATHLLHDQRKIPSL